jgi:hypothetical protein
MSDEVRIQGIPDVSQALQIIARRLKMSASALAKTGGVDNGSLTGIATGTARIKDMGMTPLLRVLQAVKWEMAGRTEDPRGLVVHPEGALGMRICAADGGRLDVPFVSVKDLPLLLNTMAAANGLTVTALNKAAGVAGGSLIAIAKGTGPNADVRLANLVKVARAAKFELIIRPVHTTRRSARIALAASVRG